MENGKLFTTLKWVGGLALVAFVAPAIFLAVQGLIGLALAGVIVATAWYGWPVLAAWMSSTALKLLKMDARANPIETMQGLYAAKMAQLASVKKSLTEFKAEVDMFALQVQTLARRQPEDAAAFQNQLASMRTLLTRRSEAVAAAEVELDKYKAGIARARAIWEVAQSANRLSSSAKKMGASAVFDEIRHDEAIRSVERSMVTAFSELDALQNAKVGDIVGQVPQSEVQLLAASPATELTPRTHQQVQDVVAASSAGGLFGKFNNK